MPMRSPILSHCLLEEKLVTQPGLLHSHWASPSSSPFSPAHPSVCSFECLTTHSPIPLLFPHVCCSQPVPSADISLFPGASLFPFWNIHFYLSSGVLVSHPSLRDFFSPLHPHPLATGRLLLLSAEVPITNGQQVDQISIATERNKEARLSESSMSLQDADIAEKDSLPSHSWLLEMDSCQYNL